MMHAWSVKVNGSQLAGAAPRAEHSEDIFARLATDLLRAGLA